MARIAGKGGNVFVASQLIEDCESIWTTGGAGKTVSSDTSIYRVGSASAKVATVGIGATSLLQYKDFDALNLSGYTHLMMWIRASINTDAEDLKILLDDTSACVSALEQLAMPALTANTWKFVTVAFATPANLSAVISIGLYQLVDLADASFYVDDIRAAKEVAGMKSWTIDQKIETIDVTGFDSDGVKEFVAGTSEWSGAFEGFKDGVPLTIGTVVGLELRESSTSTQQFRGAAIITGRSVKTDITGAVTYSYTFQGLHALTIPTT